MEERNDIPNEVGITPKSNPNRKTMIIIICCVAFAVISIIGNMIPLFLQQPLLDVISGDSVKNGEILSKTVMIYLDGADLEEEHGDATTTISEIIASGVDTNFHNILIYTGGCNKWKGYDIPTDKDCIYILRNGELKLLEQYKPKNLGDPQTLQTFMQYCVTNYPAQQYGLILHNHGGGPAHGVCFDFRNNNDPLHLPELQKAFRSVGFGPKSKMEFIIFDACLMSSAEVAFCMKDYAQYMVASQNVSYVYGSDYSFMKSLDLYNSGADIGTKYVECYYNESVALGERLYAQGTDVYDITYSCIKLSEMDRVEKALNNLFKEAAKDGNKEKFLGHTARLARGVKEYADFYGQSTDTTYDLIDLTDWMQLSASADRVLTEAVISAVDAAVVCNKANTPKMHGLTIYYPEHIWTQYYYNVFDFADSYAKYVKRCYANAVDGINRDTWQQIDTETEYTDGSSILTVRLTDKQAENFASANYYILAKYNNKAHTFAEDEYVIVLQGNNYSITGNNVLCANFDYRIPTIYKADGTSTPFFSPLFAKTTESGNTIYSASASLTFVPDAADYPGIDDPEGLNSMLWQIENMRLDVAWLSMQKQGNTLKMLYAEKQGNGDLPSRMLLELSDYQEIEFFSFLRKVKYDNAGKPLPVSQWEKDTHYLATNYDINDIFIRMEQLSEEVSYYGIIVFTDIYGNQFTTDIMPLQ